MDFNFLSEFTSKILEDDSGSSKTNRRPKTKKTKPLKKKKLKVLKCHFCPKKFTEEKLQEHERQHDSEKPHQCLHCDLSFKHKKYLTRHVKVVHSGPGGHRCEICDKLFKFPHKLRDHMYTHTGEKPYACNICDKAFNSTYSLKTHMYIHTDEKPYGCDVCEYACRDSSTLRKHKEYHAEIRTSYSCSLCDNSYRLKSQLKEHVLEIHFGVDIRTHMCDKCDMRFKAKGPLNLHIRNVHNKVFSRRVPCPVCNKTISNRGNLKEHMKRHSGVRKYVCDYEGCDKRYMDPSGLKKHLSRNHGGRATKIEGVKSEREVECDYCGKRLNNKNILVRHMAQFHNKCKNKYKCSVCEYQTNDKKRYRQHIYKYHGMTIYYCALCEQRFRKRRTYKDHMEVIHGTDKDESPPPLQPALEVSVKQEPLDLEDPEMTSVDLFHLENHQVLGDLIRKTTNPDPQTDEQTNTEISETAELTTTKQEYITQEELEQYCTKGVMEAGKLLHKKKTKYAAHIDKNADRRARKYVRKIKAKLSREQRISELESVRREYNRRISKQTDQCGKAENIKIKYYKCNEKTENKPKDSSQVEERVEKTEKCDGNDKDEEQTDTKDKDNGAKTCEETISREENMSCDENKCDENTATKEKNVDALVCDGTITCEENMSCDENTATKEKNDEALVCDKTITCEGNKTNDEINHCEENTSHEHKIDEENISQDDEEANDGIDDKDYECEEMKKTKSKLKLNTHQCYICFKLFATKPEFLEHCKEHFNSTQALPIKKCPLCSFKTEHSLRRHLQIMHEVDIQMPYHHLKDTSDKNKFYYEIKTKNTENIKKIEIIPSVRNLNKKAYENIDANNRKSNNNTIQKTKLVKKGKEWVVEKEKVNIKYHDYIMPDIDYKEIDTSDLDTDNKSKNDIYVTCLRKLYQIAKTDGNKILFPCNGCEKICQNLAALKLHLRKHDKYAKPFKPKVYKDKTLVNIRGKKKKKVQKNKNKGADGKINNNNKRTGKKVRKIKVKINKNKMDNDKINKEYQAKLENRQAKPRSATNNHRCDPKLMDFYQNNIRGKDIEFWQFLKIFNKMGRENIADFKDLEKREDLESYCDKIVKYDEKETENNQNSTNNHNETLESSPNVSSTTSKVKISNETGFHRKIKNKNVNIINKSKFKRVIRISRAEYIKRNALKDKLREEIAKRNQVV